MKRFLIVVVLTAGCTGADISADSGTDAGVDNAGQTGGAGGMDGTAGNPVILAPGAGGVEATGGMEATGGVEATGGMDSPGTGGSVGTGGQDSFVMADILPGEWKMLINTERYYCGMFQEATNDETPRDVLITDDFEFFIQGHSGPVFWWGAGVVGDEVWEPDVSTWSATYVELRADGPDRLVGTGENDPGPCAPGVSGLTATYVFELTR